MTGFKVFLDLIIQSDSRSRRDRRRSTDQEIFPDIGDLVTVDTVGFEDDTVFPDLLLW